MSSDLYFPSGLSLTRAKKDAKKLAKLEGLKLHEAQDRIARENGMNCSWSQAVEILKDDLGDCAYAPKQTFEVIREIFEGLQRLAPADSKADMSYGVAAGDALLCIGGNLSTFMISEVMNRKDDLSALITNAEKANARKETLSTLHKLDRLWESLAATREANIELLDLLDYPKGADKSVRGAMKQWAYEGKLFSVFDPRGPWDPKLKRAIMDEFLRSGRNEEFRFIELDETDVDRFKRGLELQARRPAQTSIGHEGSSATKTYNKARQGKNVSLSDFLNGLKLNPALPKPLFKELVSHTALWDDAVAWLTESGTILLHRYGSKNDLVRKLDDVEWDEISKNGIEDLGKPKNHLIIRDGWPEEVKERPSSTRHQAEVHFIGTGMSKGGVGKSTAAVHTACNRDGKTLFADNDVQRNMKEMPNTNERRQKDFESYKNALLSLSEKEKRTFLVKAIKIGEDSRHTPLAQPLSLELIEGASLDAVNQYVESLAYRSFYECYFGSPPCDALDWLINKHLRTPHYENKKTEIDKFLEQFE